VFHWLLHLYSQDGVHDLIARGGLAALCLVIFAETGLFVGFCLPGDSLLMTAGVCCRIDPLRPGAPALLDLGITLSTLMVAAAVGNILNYQFGRMTGTRVRARPDGMWFKQRHLQEGEEFYRRWGGWAVVAGRFVPIVRTFVPFVAGMAGMAWPSFLLWSTAGGVAWVGSMVGLGYWLAHSQALVHQLHVLVLLIIAVSFVPIGLGVLTRWRRGAPVQGGV